MGPLLGPGPAAGGGAAGGAARLMIFKGLQGLPFYEHGSVLQGFARIFRRCDLSCDLKRQQSRCPRTPISSEDHTRNKEQIVPRTCRASQPRWRCCSCRHGPMPQRRWGVRLRHEKSVWDGLSASFLSKRRMARFVAQPDGNPTGQRRRTSTRAVWGAHGLARCPWSNSQAQPAHGQRSTAAACSQTALPLRAAMR